MTARKAPVLCAKDRLWAASFFFFPDLNGKKAKEISHLHSVDVEEYRLMSSTDCFSNLWSVCFGDGGSADG